MSTAVDDNTAQIEFMYIFLFAHAKKKERKTIQKYNSITPTIPKLTKAKLNPVPTVSSSVILSVEI
jgi:hypothetical protein